ncbi:hypothetical protein [Nocardia testacea]|uniref:hypothetical protein n=1 Tax=Nocardia testacea TaxID=248551 RepID=UPI003A8BC14F
MVVDDHGLWEEPVHGDETQLRRSADDDETLLSVVSPEADLPISFAGAKRLWEAVTATPGDEPDFVDLTRMTTSRPLYRQR